MTAMLRHIVIVMGTRTKIMTVVQAAVDSVMLRERAKGFVVAGVFSDPEAARLRGRQSRD
jgi:hypothetical protein